MTVQTDKLHMWTFLQLEIPFIVIYSANIPTKTPFPETFWLTKIKYAKNNVVTAVPALALRMDINHLKPSMVLLLSGHVCPSFRV